MKSTSVRFTGVLHLARTLQVFLTTAALGVLVAAVAGAQEPATTFTELAARLKAGAAVVVTTTEGRSIDGRLVDVSQSAIVVDADRRESFAVSDVKTVVSKGKRPIVKSMLTGLVIGAGLGITAIIIDSANCPEEAICLAPGFDFAFTPVLMGIGAGAGAGIGAVIPARTKTVYRAPLASGTSSLGVAPVLGAKRLGLELQLAF